MPPGMKLGSTRVSFSPDGTMVAAGTNDGGIVVWNVGTGINDEDDADTNTDDRI